MLILEQGKIYPAMSGTIRPRSKPDQTTRGANCAPIFIENMLIFECVQDTTLSASQQHFSRRAWCQWSNLLLNSTWRLPRD
eukprot:SAG11_NODE_1708_length_4407_cov_6.993036_4_plen_81_part_00